MRTFCRPQVFPGLLLGVLLLAGASLCASCAAQTLARPGWVGSGLSAEPWWRSAVFYRISPEGFQDSDGDGLGDLRGIALRMDYLQQLGVDAIVLQMPFAESGFDDLLDEASSHHIRLLVALPSSDGASVLPIARQWLTRGVAGVWLRVGRGEAAEHTASLLHNLRTLTDGYPGQRIVVEDTTADRAMLPAAGATLVARAIPAIAARGGDAVSLRLAMAQAQSVPVGSAPLLVLGEPPRAATRTAEQEKILAAALIASRAAVAMDFGQEIGMPAAADENGTRIMQWTPTNITTAQKAASPVPKPAPPPLSHEDVYGAFVPYVPPAKVEPQQSKNSFDGLMGFTYGTLPEAATGGAAANSVAAQDADANSLLAFYRKLTQLHHDHPAVRAGTSYALDHDAEDALVWVLRAPANARTATTVIVACNLTGQRIVLPLRADTLRLGIRFAELRVLLTSARTNAQVDQNTNTVTLAPWSVYIAELDH